MWSFKEKWIFTSAFPFFFFSFVFFHFAFDYETILNWQSPWFIIVDGMKQCWTNVGAILKGQTTIATQESRAWEAKKTSTWEQKKNMYLLKRSSVTRGSSTQYSKALLCKPTLGSHNELTTALRCSAPHSHQPPYIGISLSIPQFRVWQLGLRKPMLIALDILNPYTYPHWYPSCTKMHNNGTWYDSYHAYTYSCCYFINFGVMAIIVKTTCKCS